MNEYNVISLICKLKPFLAQGSKEYKTEIRIFSSH
jgi:hypothetical protein